MRKDILYRNSSSSERNNLAVHFLEHLWAVHTCAGAMPRSTYFPQAPDFGHGYHGVVSVYLGSLPAGPFDYDDDNGDDDVDFAAPFSAPHRRFRRAGHSSAPFTAFLLNFALPSSATHTLLQLCLTFLTSSLWILSNMVSSVVLALLALNWRRANAKLMSNVFRYYGELAEALPARLGLTATTSQELQLLRVKHMYTYNQLKLWFEARSQRRSGRRCSHSFSHLRRNRRTRLPLVSSTPTRSAHSHSNCHRDETHRNACARGGGSQPPRSPQGKAADV